jgi:hypothetical protein
METIQSASGVNGVDPGLHPVPTLDQPVALRPWLLELEVDGTIRYSNNHPQSADGNVYESLVGSYLFELSGLLDLSSFRRDFVGFVRGVRNRQTFQLRDHTGAIEAVVVLTRSFDTSEAGPPNEIILMELKRI